MMRQLLALALLVLSSLPAHASWTSVGTLGSNQSKTANKSSMSMTTSAAAEASNMVVLVVTCDNNQTTDGDEGMVSGVTDSAGGNTWTKGKEFTNGQGTAQTGATVSLWFSKLTNQINSGGTITAALTNNTTRDACGISAWEFTIGAGNVVTVEATNTLANDGADFGSLNATTSNAEFLRIRAGAVEMGDAADFDVTPTTNWTEMTQNGTSGAGSATNMQVWGEFRISTGTSDASDPTHNTFPANDKASVYVALKEAAASVAARRRVIRW